MILQHPITRDHAERLSVLPMRLDPQHYAFALPPRQTERRELLNRGLLRILDGDTRPTRLRSYPGEEEF